jgi:hypothetical protein
MHLNLNADVLGPRHVHVAQDRTATKGAVSHQRASGALDAYHNISNVSL